MRCNRGVTPGYNQKAEDHKLTTTILVRCDKNKTPYIKTLRQRLEEFTSRLRIQAQERRQVATPSKLFEHVLNLAAGTPVVLVARVSHSNQDRTGNLQQQMASLRKVAKLHKLFVIGEHCYIGSGVDPDLTMPALMCIKHKAVMLFETVDRALRPPDYHYTDNPNAPLIESDLREFR